MLKNKFRYLIIIIIILTIALSGCDNSPGQFSFNVYGTITTESLDKPIKDVKVSIAGKTDYTDENGNYSIQNISEGTYNWQVESTKYSDYNQDVYINSDLNISKQLSLITVNATITGTVNIYNSDQEHAIQSMSLDKNIDTEKITLNSTKSEQNFKENHLIINYNENISYDEIQIFENNNNLFKIRKLNLQDNNVFLYKLPSTKDVLNTVKEFNEYKIIEWAEPNYIIKLNTHPNDSLYSDQWGHRTVNLEPAWDIYYSTNNIKVAVIDSGIIPGHEDLTENVSYDQGKDFIDDDNEPNDENADYSHGTHVSGIIGAVTNNSRGVAGVGRNIDIIPIRIFENDQVQTASDIAEAINYAVDQNVDIINMSFGGYNSLTMHEPIKNAYNEGIILVASSGNYGENEVLYPARFPETIAVGATDINDNITNYSNEGGNLDLVAPGGSESTYGILSTSGYNKDYVEMVGTSMAAPYVSGVAALLLAEGVSPSQIRHRLTSTAVDLGPAGKDNTYGYGLVDAYGALINKKLKRPYVFAAVKENGTIKIKSEFITIDKNNTYKLNEIVDDEVIVVAWRDVNDNKEVDAGDYYGEYNEKINILENTLYNNIDIDMYYIPINDNRNIEVMNMTKTSKL